MDHFTKGSEEPDQDRLTRRFRRIDRRWRANQFSLASDRWWRTWKRANSSVLVGFTLAFVLLPFDVAILNVAPHPFDGLSAIPDSAVQIWVAVLILGNTLIVNGLLAWRTPDHLVVKGWIRFLCFFLSAVPLLSFYVINFWQWIIDRRPRWALAAEWDRADLQKMGPVGAIHRTTAEILARSPFASALAILWLHGGNFFLLLTWTSRLSSAGIVNGAARLVLPLQVALHVLVCCCVADSLRDYSHRHAVFGWRRILLWMPPLLALPLPFPFALVSAVAALLFEIENTRKKTLCWKTRLHGDGIDRLAAWAHLQEALDKQPGILRHRFRIEGLGRSNETGRGGKRLTAVYRFKTFLIGIDALAMGWLLGQGPGFALVTSALLGASVALLLATARMLVRSLRPHRPTWLEAHGYGGLLALGLIFAVTGFQVGAWFRQGEVQEAGLLVTSLAMIGIVLAGLALALQPFCTRPDTHMQDRHGDFVWMLFFICILLFSLLVALDEDRTATYVRVVSTVALLAPLWHLILAALFQGCLLRPYRLRSLLNERSPHRRLAFLLTTLALPLGGFAVPYWIYIRHRDWPKHDPLGRGDGS